jgi:XTP/dITP diphosphohydrolase
VRTTINIVNTSNKGKIAEFSRLFAKHGYVNDKLVFKGVDLNEIDAEPEMVAAMKAVMAAKHHGLPNVLIDDTSLDIEGAPGAGVNIRWILDNEPDKFQKYIGKPATFRCILAYANLQGVVNLAVGEIKGTISAKRELPGVKSFGFDPVFLPNLHDKTLAEAKPDECNARAIAVQHLLTHQVKRLFIPQPELWKGKWQQHSLFEPRREAVASIVKQFSSSPLAEKIEGAAPKLK